MTDGTTQQNSADARKGGRGFTLLEVMIAMVVLLVGLLGMAALAAGIVNGNAFSKKASTATTLVQDKMEEIWEQDYSDVAAEAIATLSTFPDFKRQVDVDTTTFPDIVGPPAQLTGMKIVTVTVSWTGKVGGQSVQMQTILSRSK
jgi:prepilin-type N-terminal cleavage/methylation domain-containing protein